MAHETPRQSASATGKRASLPQRLRRLAHASRLAIQLAPIYLRALPSGVAWWRIRLRLAPADLRQRLAHHTLAQRLMEQEKLLTEAQTTQPAQPANGAHPAPDTQHAQEAEGEQQKPPRVQHILLVRHGQTTYNVEGRLPGQLPGVPLTDEGRRQAHTAAVALSGLPLSAIIASPLERARDTAETIARGWALPVRLDPRLMDTDMGPWAGQKIDDLVKNEPRWKAFVEHPTEPPAGVESLATVQQRAMAAVEDARNDPETGDYLVFVAHADVVKLILAHYTNVPIDTARFMSISNASISALAFQEGQPTPALLAVNWTSAPHWLVASAQRPVSAMPEAHSQAQPPHVEEVGGALEPLKPVPPEDQPV